MAYAGKYYQGRFTPKNPQKYAGNPQNIVFRSSWERTFMEYCDTRSHVVRWASEEMAVQYFFPGDGRWHRYFPDFLLHVRTAPNTIETWMVEVKPSAQMQPPQYTGSNKRRQLKEAMAYGKNQAKWQAAMEYCRSRGWKFMVLTEKDLYPHAK